VLNLQVRDLNRVALFDADNDFIVISDHLPPDVVFTVKILDEFLQERSPKRPNLPSISRGQLTKTIDKSSTGSMDERLS